VMAAAEAVAVSMRGEAPGTMTVEAAK
jgi:hypothetical protein